MIQSSNTGSVRDDPYWASKKNSLELIELSKMNKFSLVLVFSYSNTPYSSLLMFRAESSV